MSIPLRQRIAWIVWTIVLIASLAAVYALNRQAEGRHLVADDEGAGDTRFGDINHNGIVTDTEKAGVSSLRMFYYIILGTHIPLAGIILPFILFSAYRALIGEYDKHKKLARITWPIWLYVAVTGVIVYIMISPYYD